MNHDHQHSLGSLGSNRGTADTVKSFFIFLIPNRVRELDRVGANTPPSLALGFFDLIGFSAVDGF